MLLWTAVFLTTTYRTDQFLRKFSCFHPSIVTCELDQVDDICHGCEWIDRNITIVDFRLVKLRCACNRSRCCLLNICLSTDKYGVEILALDSNFFTGSIPSEMGRLTNLTRLNLGVNSLRGTIPTEIGLLTKLGE